MTDIALNFEHRHSAHCENGVISNLFRYNGLDISEPMAFGIGSGLFFIHIPFIKVNGIPGTSYRIWPGQIFKRASKRLGVEMYSDTFRNPKKAKEALDASLAKGIPVGLVVSVFYLPYLPEVFRFHFNAHNLVVYGKEGNEYLISDPVMEHVTRIHEDDLMRARYAKGTPEPMGKMYYPTLMPKEINMKKAIVEGIYKTGYDMSHIPIPFFGSKAIRYLASKLKDYPEKVGDRKSILYLGNIIRMQEEIGTGGAGFRFVYAAFLHESGRKLENNWLIDKSKELTKTGDLWRDFAFKAGRVCKNRSADKTSFKDLSDILVECSHQEEKLFFELYSKIKTI
ncbi:MAG: BtrH N-terminal domain-containing protein [Bacteroidota bacterium]